jgi:hypothetical protein
MMNGRLPPAGRAGPVKSELGETVVINSKKKKTAPTIYSCFPVTVTGRVIN